jgi:hypothetical protein
MYIFVGIQVVKLVHGKTQILCYKILLVTKKYWLLGNMASMEGMREIDQSSLH